MADGVIVTRERLEGALDIELLAGLRALRTADSVRGIRLVVVATAAGGQQACNGNRDDELHGRQRRAAGVDQQSSTCGWK